MHGAGRVNTCFKIVGYCNTLPETKLKKDKKTFNKYESLYEKNSTHLLTHDFMTTFLFSKTTSTVKESNITKLISNCLLTIQNRVCEYHQVLRISVRLHSRLNTIQHVDFL